jgi:hypothetical protein
MNLAPEATARRRGARARRLVATGLLAAALLYGSAYGEDDLWPLGPMVQFAFRTDPDGEISSTFIDADTTLGGRTRVDLSPRGVGIGRAEVEGQLTKIVADPSWLRDIATAQRRLHPDQPQFTRLYLRQQVTDLHHGRKVGESTRTLATWTVRP